MSYTVGPASVVVSRFEGRGVDIHAFKNLREMVEHFVSDEVLYNAKYDDDEAVAWLESLKPRIDRLVSLIREPEPGDDLDEGEDEP